MEMPDDVYTIFTAEIEPGRPASITVPDQELRLGELAEGQTYRVAILPAVESESTHQRERSGSEPPVEAGETLEVDIEDLGDKGDGIARIGPGYIIFVPGTDVGDRVEIEITEARENFGFGDVINE